MSHPNIPGFEIVDKIGQGGVATVWKARQISLDRIVAIKVLSSGLARDPADVQRFLAEAQQAARLKHPGIIQVYDANAQDGIYYFVMEYIAGYTVGDWIRRKGVLTEADAILVADAMADALDYAWRTASMIHCDIKPDNVIIDDDGTVKLADLGLSRTLNAVDKQEVSDEIMGTPAFISPEQALGEPDLDCRSDIYSMGAMLYQLVTGKMMFEGESDEQVLELQVTGTVDDPFDLNPRLNRNIGRLIEKMLAKNKEDRHADWSAVRADIARVRKGLPIHHPLPSDSACSIRRSVKQTPPPMVSARGGRAASHGGLPFMARVALFSVAAAVIVVILLVTVTHDSSPVMTPAANPGAAVTVPVASVSPPAAPVSARPPSDQSVKDAFDRAREWVVQNPENFDEGMAMFSRVAAIADGTPYAQQAESEVVRIAGLRKAAVEQVMNTLSNKTEALIEKNRFREAAWFYDNYTGPLAGETADGRKVISDELLQRLRRERHERQQANLNEEALYQGLLDRVVNDLTSVGVAQAAVNLQAAAGNDELSGENKSRIGDVSTFLYAALNVDREVMNSFSASVGKEISVVLTNGTKRVLVKEVVGGRVSALQTLVYGNKEIRAGLFFGTKDLAPQEYFSRMGPDEVPEVALVKGLIALDAKAFPHARRYFGLTSPLLSERLVAVVDSRERPPIPVAPVVQQKPESPEPVAPVQREPGGPQPVPQRVVEGNAQITDPEMLIGRLMECNPALRREEISVDAGENGVMRSIGIASSELKDLLPLARVDVRNLECGAVAANNSWQKDAKCNLSDLTPLKGASLESLFIGFTMVSDLSPLSGLPLRRLLIRQCPVTDISVLRTMTHLEEVELTNTKISDLSALAGLSLSRLDLGGLRTTEWRALSKLPLKVLNLSKASIVDISSLSRMPLTSLNLGGTSVFDFSPLRGLPLKSLWLNDTQFSDLDRLQGMALETLSLSKTSIWDLRGLKNMPLVDLSLAGCPVSDLAPLAGMKLQVLNLSDSRVADLSPLAGMPIRDLNLASTRVKDLSALAGAPLQRLNISNTRVEDVTPLAGMELKHLDARHVQVRDWSAIAGLPLNSICVDDPEGAIRNVLRRMPNLTQVNWIPYAP